MQTIGNRRVVQTPAGPWPHNLNGRCMVMNSIDDPNETAKKPATTTATEDTSKPNAEHDLLTAERAAAEREMLSGLQRAAAAAERLKELSPEDEEPEASSGREEERPSGPKFTTPLPPPFAITSNGKLLLNVDACPDLKLEGRTIFRGIELSEDEAAYAFRKIEDTIHDAAGHLGGIIKRRETEGSGGDDDR
ncbi:MAG: hypothetical protein L6Q76_23050 [Polyangiaceae bacterium]|nr:hypothetical protein [Polyangiaceae bacterium]